MAKKYDTSRFNMPDLARMTNYYMMRLCSIATSCFRWDGLPDTVDARFLEQRLLRNGSVLYFNDELIGDLVARVMMGGQMDFYDIPTERRAYANNGYQATFGPDDSVVIYDNLQHAAFFPFLEVFAKRLAALDITMDSNIAVQKYPVAVLCDDKERLSFENLFLKYSAGVPVIYGSKNLDLDRFKVLDLKAPFIADKLQEMKLNILHEAFSFLGVGSMEIEKRERMIDREVQMSQEGNIAQRASRLKARTQAADAINRMFGTDIDITYDVTAETEAVRFVKDVISDNHNPASRLPDLGGNE